MGFKTFIGAMLFVHATVVNVALAHPSLNPIIPASVPTSENGTREEVLLPQQESSLTERNTGEKMFAVDVSIKSVLLSNDEA
jgi:hypothetical protein